MTNGSKRINIQIVAAILAIVIKEESSRLVVRGGRELNSPWGGGCMIACMKKNIYIDPS